MACQIAAARDNSTTISTASVGTRRGLADRGNKTKDVLSTKAWRALGVPVALAIVEPPNFHSNASIVSKMKKWKALWMAWRKVALRRDRSG